jgi:hypothetical protein
LNTGDCLNLEHNGVYNVEIEITSGSMNQAELRAALESYLDHADVTFEERPPQYRATGLEIPIIAALISGGASTLSAFITGLFTLTAAKRKEGGKIVIRGRTGSIEVPVDTPASEIPRLVELTRQLDAPTIELP